MTRGELLPDKNVDRGALISEIRETYYMRQDMVRAMTALSNQQFAVYCRVNPDDPKCKARKNQREKWLRDLCTTNPGDPRCQEIGQSACDAHSTCADPDARRNTVADQLSVGNQVPSVSHAAEDESSGGCLDSAANHIPRDDLAALVSLPYQLAEQPLQEQRKRLEKRLEKLAEQLPVYPWVESVRGFGALGLAQIIGETGDLDHYANPAKVWKRMGLAVVNGGRQRKVAGDEALEHGYNPKRRSVMWVIGDSLLKGNRDGEYRTYYLAEKERQREIHPDMSDLQTHLRAKRHMEKRLLRDLWIQWRAVAIVEPCASLSAAD